MRNRLLWILTVALCGAALFYLERTAGSGLFARLIALTAIWSIAAIALNLTNGTAGVHNFGQHGFMLIGAYVTALLTSPKTGTVLMAPWARSLNLDWLSTNDLVQLTAAVLVSGGVAALGGLLVGVPALRLRGDYLAMATLGFGEAIRYLASTDQGSLLTNGGLGIRGIPGHFGGPFAAFVWLAATLWFFARFTQSSYGRALKSIREDELAAQAMGINVAYHKVLAFGVSAAFAGIAGGLYASWLRAIDPAAFSFFLMTYLLVAAFVGGAGSNTGAVIGTALVVLVRQFFQPIEQARPPGPLIGWALVAVAVWVIAAAWARRRRPGAAPDVRPIAGIGRAGLVSGLLAAAGVWLIAGAAPLAWLDASRPFSGLRNLLLGLVLLFVMIYRPLGVLGRSEFSWDLFLNRRPEVPTDEERSQDAWLGGETAGAGEPGAAPGEARAVGAGGPDPVGEPGAGDAGGLGAAGEARAAGEGSRAMGGPDNGGRDA